MPVEMVLPCFGRGVPSSSELLAEVLQLVGPSMRHGMVSDRRGEFSIHWNTIDASPKNGGKRSWRGLWRNWREINQRVAAGR